jgi:hypothetical protein
MNMEFFYYCINFANLKLISNLIKYLTYVIYFTNRIIAISLIRNNSKDNKTISGIVSSCQF